MTHHSDRRADVLHTAETYVNKERNEEYDEPTVDFERIAGLWAAYLDRPISKTDVAALMILLKVSRSQGTPYKFDTWVDIAGYAACGFDVAAEDIELLADAQYDTSNRYIDGFADVQWEDS